MDNGIKYEKGRMIDLHNRVNHLITKAKDVKFRVTYDQKVIVATYTFMEWVQVIYGGRSPFCDEFHDTIEEITQTTPTILTSIIFKRILWDFDCAKNGAIFDVTSLKWILKEKKDA